MAVRVGRDAISQSSVTHWARVIERGGILSESKLNNRGTPRQRALAFLISSSWLIGEAARLGLSIPAEAVERGSTERKAAGGTAESAEELQATGQTTADVKLEVRDELTLAAIRRRLAKQVATVSDAEIARFYSGHQRMFIAPERRYVDLIESLRSRSAAVALVSQIGGGQRFAKKAFHEIRSRAELGKWRIPDKEAILRAIFASRPGVVSQPMPLSGSWALFVLRKAVPPRLQSLSEVRGEITKRLVAYRRSRILSRFNREYKARWTAKTSCSPGYVVQGCVQYAGPNMPEENEFASG